MRKRAVGGIIVGVLVILICLVFIFTKNNNTQVKQQNNKSEVGIKINRRKRNLGSITKTSNGQDEKYSTDQWMLMGYMAYAYDNYVQSRHISNNSEMVTDVKEDLDNGDLKANRESANSYTLTNKFGSVGVTVQTDTVKVTGDGETTTAKSELEHKFGAYADKIKSMTQDIKTSNSDNSKTTTHNNNKDTDFNDEELITAAFLNDYNTAVPEKGVSTPQQRLILLSKVLANSQGPVKKLDTDDYVNGFYTDDGYTSIATNLSTSHSVGFRLPDHGDQIIERYAAAGTFKKRTVSKSKIIQTWKPYKNEVDKILVQIKVNKQNIPKVNKEIANMAN